MIRQAPESEGLSWLLKTNGRDANWFWRWKFKLADRAVRFDPDLCGCVRLHDGRSAPRNRRLEVAPIPVRLYERVGLSGAFLAAHLIG